MDKQNRILLAVDGSVFSEHAAKYVAWYGSLFGCGNICLVNVQSAGNNVFHVIDQNKLQIEATELARIATVNARKTLDQANLKYKSHIEIGDPADKIISVALEEKVDEIVLGSRGLGTIGNIILGSVAYKVVHHAPMPVTIVSNPIDVTNSIPYTPQPIHKVLLAVDGSECSAHAVEYVAKLHIAQIPMEVYLINVQAPIASGNIRRFISQEAIESYHKEEGQAALEKAEDMLRFAGVNFESHIIVGHAAEAITQFSKKQNCSRIVMGTRGRSLLGNIMLGSVAYHAIHLTSMPITLVKY